ncbi:MAG: hypothetical protein HYV99_09765 [Betaproteobacteria bacterium]|nr:hypothetical protein [Betaproteobacteria bacterium]MBI2510230.1 hypothetical protein [Betaproteobacteria bacterium]
MKSPSTTVRSEPVEDRTLRTGPGGMSMSELHERVKQSHLRDQAAAKQHNKLAQPQNRWQRFVRYVWDKNRGRG